MYITIIITSFLAIGMCVLAYTLAINVSKLEVEKTFLKSNVEFLTKRIEQLTKDKEEYLKFGDNKRHYELRRNLDKIHSMIKEQSQMNIMIEKLFNDIINTVTDEEKTDE